MSIKTILTCFACMSLSMCILGQVSRVLDTLDTSAYLQKAETYYSSRDYKEAIETLDNLIQSANPDSESNYLFEGYTMLGDIYLSLKDYERSSETFTRALEIAQKSKNDTLNAKALGNLGHVYLFLPEKEKQGIENYNRSIAINDKIGREKENFDAYINISRAYLQEDRLDIAYPNLMKAKQIIRVYGLDEKSQVQTLALLGRYYCESDRAILAEDDLLKAEEIAMNHGLVTEEEEVQRELAHFYKKQENYEAALYHKERQLELANELYKNQKEKEIQNASAQFDIREYQRELEIAKNEQIFKDQLFTSSKKTASTFLISSIVLLISLLVIVYMYRSRKQYIKRLRRRNRQLIIAKEGAEKLSKLKTQFFSTISHELRTPLYGVIGIASILLEDKQIKSHRDDLKSLKFSADYLLALINDVLLMSKMESKNIKLEYAPFRLSTLLTSITRSFEFSLEQNNNILHLEIDPKIPDTLIGDSVRLSQILMNLIGNAIKFNENGNIWVYIKNQNIDASGDHEIQFIVKDDGIGIPKESQKTIFEEFSQVQHENYNYQGTGLGLSIVLKLLKLYGSKIELESEEGKGATFSFTIKLKAGVSTTSGHESISIDNLDGARVSQNTHILVVDDNKINQKITQKILMSREYSCSIANDGVEAIAMARDSKYDLILMDIHMPKKNGIDATIEIREFDQETPIVALTAVEIAEIRHKIQNAGMDDILVKPYDISQFLNIIIRNLGGRRPEPLQYSGS